MKPKNNIDELLSGYIDEELTPRQTTQVRRLLANDASVAERLKQLQRIRGLYQAMPVVEAPADIADRVTSLLERRTLLEQNTVVSVDRQRRGAASLFIRKFMAAAAMIALVGLLGVVIYSIVAPEPGPGTTVAVDPGNPDSGTGVEPAPAVKTIVAMGFTGRLELHTANLMAIDGLVNKAVTSDPLIESQIERLATTSQYTIKCTPRSLDQLLIRLQDSWSELESARLIVETGTVGKTVVIESVTPKQVSEVAQQDNADTTIKVAKDFARVNSLTGEIVPGPFNPEISNLPIPRPRTASSDADLDKGQVDLVILIETNK